MRAMSIEDFVMLDAGWLANYLGSTTGVLRGYQSHDLRRVPE